MDVLTYEAEAEAEERHWWFVGRRQLFARVVRRLNLPKDARILEAGTSTGTNLRLLGELGYDHVQGVDVSDEAIRYCAAKQLGNVTKGDLCQLPFAAGVFDLVIASDVIEHLDDDRQATREILRVLKPGGHALITVPAFPCLWGRQDVVSHHKRRYRKRGLRQLFADAELECLDAFHFNYLLFLPIWIARKAISWLRIPVRSEFDVNTSLINRLLTWVFRLDVWSARVIRPPFGVSILALCRKPLTAATALPAAA